MQRRSSIGKVRVVFRLLVLLCLSLYGAMLVFGDGPTRLDRVTDAPTAPVPGDSGTDGAVYAPEPADAGRIVRAATVSNPVATSGIRVLAAPEPAPATPPAPQAVAAIAQDAPAVVPSLTDPASLTASDATFAQPGADAPDPVFVQIATADAAADSVFAPATAETAGVAATVQAGRIGDKAANVRAAADKGSERVGQLAAGATVQVLWAEANGWVRVISQDGMTSGFVHKSLFAELPATEAAADAGPDPASGAALTGTN